jgi:hypothetical protein
LPSVGTRDGPDLPSLRIVAPVRAARTVAIALVAFSLAAGCGGAASNDTTSATATTRTTASQAPVPVATMAPWRLPRPLSREVAGVVGGRIVVAGGLTTGDHTTGEVRSIDAVSGVTAVRPPIPRAVHDAGAAVLLGKLLVVGGGAASVVDTVQSAAPITGLVGRLPRPRADLAVAAVGHVGYVFGGYDGRGALAGVLATTDGHAFRSAGHLQEAVRYPAVAAVGGKVVIVGGETASGADSSSIQVYDPATAATHIAGRLPVGRSHASALVLAGRLWVVGGRVGGVPSPSIIGVDPITGASVDAGRLPSPIRDAAVVTIGPTGYLLGGQHPLPTTDVVLLRVPAH